jgi:hypothetical protein
VVYVLASSSFVTVRTLYVHLPLGGCTVSMFLYVLEMFLHVTVTVVLYVLIVF